jgi:hypothetical protein
MAESLSHSFIASLEPQRDLVFTEALGCGRVAGQPLVPADFVRAESLLLKAVRPVFRLYAAGSAPVDLLAALRQEWLIAGAAASAADTPVAPVQAGLEPMPAAVWARLAAAVQVEAATLPGAKALNPDSVLLAPDPLLAPKKPKPAEDSLDLLGMAPRSQFAMFALVALLVGLGVTIYLTTRRHSSSVPTTQPTTLPAASASSPGAL